MSNSSYRFNRTEFIKALQQWCGERYKPKVAFPERDGFSNVAYLYEDHYKDIIEDIPLLEQYLQKELKVPVVLLVNPMSMSRDNAMYCSEWLD